MHACMHTYGYLLIIATIITVFGALTTMGVSAEVTFDTSYYKYNGEEGVTITGFNGLNGGERVEIPPKIDGKPVLAIGLDGVVTTTHVPGADKIGALGLSGANVEVILPYAFCGCENLTGEIGSTSGVEKVGNLAFKGCTGITRVSLNKCIQVGERAFEECTGLQKLDFFSLETVEYAAFRDCTGLYDDKVLFPALKTVEESAFEGCTGLKRITDHQFPMIRTIKCNAFRGCTGLKNVSLSVLEIGTGAFQDCTGLESVYLPEPYGIESGAFGNCPALKEVKWDFRGNYLYALSNVPDNCQIYYVDGNGNTVDQYSFYDQYKQWWYHLKIYDVPFYHIYLA